MAGREAAFAFGRRIGELFRPLETKLETLQFVKAIEHKTGVKRRLVLFSISTLFCLVAFAVIGLLPLLTHCNTALTVLLPLVLSFKSLPAHEHSDQTQPAVAWLCYWIAFIFLGLVRSPIQWLATHADTWWVVDYLFVALRFLLLAGFAVADNALRDTACRKIFFALRKKMSSLSNMGQSTGSSHHGASGGGDASLESGDRAPMNIASPRGSAPSTELYQRKVNAPAGGSQAEFTAT